MNNLETMILIGHCLTPGREDLNDVLAARLDAAGVDWKRLVLIASGHYLAPSFYLALRRRGLLDFVPAEIREVLQAMASLNRERNELLYSELVSITRQLNSIGVEPLLLKGAICLLPGQYPGAGGRVLGDLDLLVPKDRVEESIRSLAEVRYGFHPRAVHIRYETRHHLSPLFHAEHPVVLEIHREVNRRGVRPVFTTEEMWQSARPVEFPGARARVPDHLMRLLHNVVHTRLADQGHRNFVLEMRQLNEWVQLRDFCAAEVDLNRIWERFNQHGEAAVLESYLLAAQRFFDQPLPPGVDPSPKAYRFERITCLALRVPALWTVLNRDRYLVYVKRLLSPAWYRRKFREARAGQAWWGVFK